MGLCNSPDIYQEKMNKLLNGLEYFSTFVDDLMIISNIFLEDHIKKLDQVLNKLKSAGIKVNAENPFSPEMNWNTQVSK